MFELLGLAVLAVVVVGVAASRNDSEQDNSWACQDKFTSSMPQEVRDQALAVMRNGTDPVAMVKFATILRSGGFTEAANCVEARANELLSKAGGGAAGGGVVEKPKTFPTAPVFAPKFGDPSKAALAPSGTIPLFWADPTGVPAAPPKGSGVSSD